MWHFILQVLQFINNNQDLIIALIPVIFALVKLTKWGKSNQQALIIVASAVESASAGHIKAEVAMSSELTSDAVKDALAHAVAVVDVKKEPKTAWSRLLIETCRGIMPKGVK